MVVNEVFGVLSGVGVGCFEKCGGFVEIVYVEGGGVFGEDGGKCGIEVFV